MPDKIAMVQEAHQMLKEAFTSFDLEHNTQKERVIALRDRCIEILQVVTEQIPDLWDAPNTMAEGIEREKLKNILKEREPFEQWDSLLRYAQIEIVRRVQESKKKKKRWW